MFAGSGNLGLEALSNGASKCYFVDNNKQAINVLNKNIQSLNDKNSIILNMDYVKALEYFKEKNILKYIILDLS